MKNFLLVLFLLTIFFNFTYAQTTYYIDSSGGNDSNTGTTEQSAWKTLNKANGFSFNTSGGNVYVKLKRGEIWRETLNPNRGGSGENNRIIFSSYGTGRKPQILGSNDLRSSTTTWTDMGSIMLKLESYF